MRSYWSLLGSLGFWLARKPMGSGSSKGSYLRFAPPDSRFSLRCRNEWRPTAPLPAASSAPSPSSLTPPTCPGTGLSAPASSTAGGGTGSAICAPHQPPRTPPAAAGLVRGRRGAKTASSPSGRAQGGSRPKKGHCQEHATPARREVPEVAPPAAAGCNLNAAWMVRRARGSVGAPGGARAAGTRGRRDRPAGRRRRRAPRIGGRCAVRVWTAPLAHDGELGAQLPGHVLLVRAAADQLH